MSMTNREIAKHIDAFKYWCETNEENGVITIPKFLCEHIVEILNNNKERPHGTWERVDKWVDGKYVGGFIHKECPMIKISDDCLYAPWTYNFCPNCGADMREGDSDA